MHATLAPVLIVFALVAQLLPMAAADHHPCSWSGPGNDPAYANYQYFCTAKKSNVADDGSTADYLCNDGWSTKVADYGKFAGGILEFASPCSKSTGFAWSGDCYRSSLWGICLGNRSLITHQFDMCRYMRSTDDCMWTDPVIAMPDLVTIFKSIDPLGPPAVKKEKE